MVNPRAAKIAAIVVGGALLIITAGQILRIFTRFMTWAMLIATVVVLGYAAYSVVKGWDEAAESSEHRAATDATDPMEQAKADYMEGDLTEEELEEELEALATEEQ